LRKIAHPTDICLCHERTDINHRLLASGGREEILRGRVAGLKGLRLIKATVKQGLILSDKMIDISAYLNP
jgi:hypothetical protein